VAEFEWDEESKAGINFRRHGIRIPEAIPVFDDPHAITITDDVSAPSEQRYVTLGMGAMGRMLGCRVHLARRKHPHHFRASRRTI
jgi:uncharacterized protein